MDHEAITAFKDDYRFLSNFYPCPVKMGGVQYQSVEHAYQAAKTSDVNVKRKFRHMTAGAARTFGKTVTLRPDWDTVRVPTMLQLLRVKFTEPSMKDRLLATGERELIEDNHWGDHFWGVCRGTGENMLGKLLMQVRQELR